MTYEIETKNFLHSGAVLLLAPTYSILSIAAVMSRKNALLKSMASHGKTRKISSNRWLEIHVPKRYFGHFYVVGLLSAAGVFYLAGEVQWLSSSQLLLFAHLSRRAYECWYIHRFQPHGTMHFAGYLLGVGHYGILPLVFVGRSRGSVPFALNALCCTGNLWVQYEQHMHHKILAGLRPIGSAAKNQDTAYRLPPKQRWFRWSLSPHYLAEIILYASWAILLSCEPSWSIELSRWYSFHLPAGSVRALELLATQRHWFLFLWVLTNLSVSSLNNRDWYRQKCPGLSQAALFPWWLSS